MFSYKTNATSAPRPNMAPDAALMFAFAAEEDSLAEPLSEAEALALEVDVPSSLLLSLLSFEPDSLGVVDAALAPVVTPVAPEPRTTVVELPTEMVKDEALP